MRRLGRCYRCLYVWETRRRRNPTVCPRCKSRLWNVPRVRPWTPGAGLGIEDILGAHRGEVLRLARKYGATNVRVFGSVRRGQAGPDSDVDLLVDWRRGSNALSLALELTALLGREVDVTTPDRLWWAAAPSILAEATPL